MRTGEESALQSRACLPLIVCVRLFCETNRRVEKVYRGEAGILSDGACHGNARRGFSEGGLEIDLTLLGDHQVRSFKVFANAGCLQYGIDPALHDGPGKCEQASSQPTGSPFPSMSITS